MYNLQGENKIVNPWGGYVDSSSPSPSTAAPGQKMKVEHL